MGKIIELFSREVREIIDIKKSKHKKQKIHGLAKEKSVLRRIIEIEEEEPKKILESIEEEKQIDAIISELLKLYKDFKTSSKGSHIIEVRFPSTGITKKYELDFLKK